MNYPGNRRLLKTLETSKEQIKELIDNDIDYDSNNEFISNYSALTNEDLHVITEDLLHTVEDLENKICDLTTLLEHYEKINNKRIRKNILAHKDEIDNMY